MNETETPNVIPLEDVPISSTPSPVVRGWRWILQHWIISASLVVVLFIIVEYFSLPSFSNIEALKRENPRTSAMMDARKREREHDGKRWRQEQSWIVLSNVSSHLIHAVIVAEDGTFYEHEGVDWYEVQESLKKDLRETRFARGASTITQQLAKNLYLSSSKDPLRKLKEFIITKRLEEVLSKDRLMELYLNIIELGEGIFGIDAAARKFFRKSASELSRDESIRLAAIIPSPLRHRPTDESTYVRYRSQLISKRMESRGW